MNTRHIENRLYHLEVDTSCGRLVRLHDKVGDFAVNPSPPGSSGNGGAESNFLSVIKDA